ncbi:unnamed protein product [Cuscuta campestris]|uniref:Transposase (putative) gypsy type domain-containing protein n=1 Tax=Cuscuta campestris TaxID=132261 RepID=A0A484NIU2_9ASTE|nr:unnamed protein product [Cuscuta campestris]
MRAMDLRTVRTRSYDPTLEVGTASLVPKYWPSRKTTTMEHIITTESYYGLVCLGAPTQRHISFSFFTFTSLPLSRVGVDKIPATKTMGWVGESNPELMDTDFCIGFALRNVIQTGANKAAKEKGILAPQISLTQLVDIVKKFPNTPQRRNIKNVLNYLMKMKATDGLVAEDDYDKSTKAPRKGARRYRMIASWTGIDPEDENFSDQVMTAIRTNGAVVGELCMPSSSKIEIGHAVSFIGWEYKRQGISSSDAYASEESSTSSSSTGSSLSSFETRSGPNTTVPEPQPVNQMPGQVSQERDEPVDDEPAPYDPDSESYERWVNRLDAAGYFPLPSSYPLDIYPRVSKIAQNKARRNLPEGYVLEYDPSWPNIIEPHRDDRVGFHIISLESGTVFPLRPLLVELCHCFKVLPGQLTPNAHRFLNAFVNICSHLKIDPSLRFFLYLFEVLPGKSGCDGYVYFKGRNGRQFISDLPQSNRLWKEKFVFIKFPTVSPLAGIKWNDHLLKPQYTEPANAPDLEESLEKLLQGDPFTGQMFHYGAWIWRISPGGTGTPRANEAAGHGVPAPGNTAEAGGSSHPEMNFRAFNIPTKKTGGPSSTAPRTVLVQQEPVEINSEEETRPTGRTSQAGRTTVNPPLDKGKGKVRTKHAAATHPSAKRRRGESVPATESLEELWVKMGRKLKEMGEVGPETLRKLAEDSPSRSLQLEEKLKRLEAHNQELQDLTTRQLDEMANLSAVAGRANAEEQERPGRARQWMEENLVEAARVLTSSEERTMEGFKLLYREEQGKEMITQIGSYGFMSGQKRDREATHAILAERDPDFNAESYGLAPIPDEEPAPPFPLE